MRYVHKRSSRRLPPPWWPPLTVSLFERVFEQVDFPPKYWQRLAEEWAKDYEATASTAPSARAAAISTELTPLRDLNLPILVLGSKGDVVSNAAKMEAELTPALGKSAEYRSLPRDGGHTFFNDNGNNGNIYDLAGPVLAAWLRKKVS